MTAQRWVALFLIVGGVCTAWVISAHHHPLSSPTGVRIESRKRAITDEVQSTCREAKSKLTFFRSKYPKSIEASKQAEPEKTEWRALKAAQRDCEAAQALLDPPLPLKIYKQDKEKA